MTLVVLLIQMSAMPVKLCKFWIFFNNVSQKISLTTIYDLMQLHLKLVKRNYI